MLKLPVVIVQKGGRTEDVEAKVTLRFEPGASARPFEVETTMPIVDVDVERDGVPVEVWVEQGVLPRAVYDACVTGMEEELRDRRNSGRVVPPLRVVIEAAVIHPVDCRLRAHREAGRRALARVLDAEPDSH